jgi:hypothetical protein
LTPATAAPSPTRRPTAVIAAEKVATKSINAGPLGPAVIIEFSALEAATAEAAVAESAAGQQQDYGLSGVSLCVL